MNATQLKLPLGENPHRCNFFFFFGENPGDDSSLMRTRYLPQKVWSPLPIFTRPDVAPINDPRNLSEGHMITANETLAVALMACILSELRKDARRSLLHISLKPLWRQPVTDQSQKTIGLSIMSPHQKRVHCLICEPLSHL